MNKHTFKQAEIYDILEEAVEHTSDSSYRYGSCEHYVVPYDGKFWSFTITSSPKWRIGYLW